MKSKVDVTLSDVVAHRGRRAILISKRRITRVETKLLHQVVGLVSCLNRTRRRSEPMQYQPVGRIRDRLFAGREQITGCREIAEITAECSELFTEQIRFRSVRVDRPRIVHGCRYMEQVACVHGRARKIIANRAQYDFVPGPGDRRTAVVGSLLDHFDSVRPTAAADRKCQREKSASPVHRAYSPCAMPTIAHSLPLALN